MATIIFAITDSISHYNASYKIANKLKRRGHTIIYIGDSSNREKEVIGQGFQFEIIYNDFFKRFEEGGNKGYRKSIGKFISYFKSLINYRKALVSGEEIKKLIDKLNPDLFIIDVFHFMHAATIYKFNTRIVMLQTYVATDKDFRVPPLNSSIIPAKSLWTNIQIELVWFRIFVRRFFLDLFFKVFFLGLDKNGLTKTVVKSSNIGSKNVNYKRAFHPGFNNLPELILCASEFDFVRENRPNRHFVGPMVELDRRDVLYDARYLEVILQKELECEDDADQVLIYCSLGTLSNSWYNQSDSFFKLLIAAFSIKTNYELFMSVGAEINPAIFGQVPPNVHIFQLVPQIDILERASLMITHGGINSINECIFSGVPMIVYPLSAHVDQPGNAARVEYHGLGIRGNIRQETTEGIISKIDAILSDPSYKQNVEKMKAIYSNYEKENKVVNIIESQLPLPVLEPVLADYNQLLTI